MTLQKKEIRKILQKIKAGRELTSKDRKEGYLISFLLLIIIGIFGIPPYIILFKGLPLSFNELDIFSLAPFLIIIILVLSILYLLLWKTPSSDRKYKELASLENIRENASKKKICEMLGKSIYIELNPNHTPMNIHQTDICKELLKQDDVKNNNELMFHIFNKLYKFYFIDEEYINAIEALNFALAINPSEIITNVCLAEMYEYIGKGDKAIKTYEATKIMCSLSSNLTKYIDNQIVIVRKKGPRKAPPITGFRYGTF